MYIGEQLPLLNTHCLVFSPYRNKEEQVGLRFCRLGSICTQIIHLILPEAQQQEARNLGRRPGGWSRVPVLNTPSGVRLGLRDTWVGGGLRPRGGGGDSVGFVELELLAGAGGYWMTSAQEGDSEAKGSSLAIPPKGICSVF